MATLTDRPQQKTPAQPEPATRPPRLPERPTWTGRPTRTPEPNRRRDRWLACLYLFGPAAVLILGPLAVIAVVLTLALGASAEAPPATGAARLVPGNALLYLHVSTDSSRPAVGRALALGRRLPGSPLLFAALTTRLDGILGGSPDAAVSFSADVRPWLGQEAALAVLDTPGNSAGTLLVLDVRKPGAARRFLARVGAQPDGSFRGVRLLAEPGGTALAFVRHYLVVGQLASVEGAIYVADGKAPSLASSPPYERAAAGEPADRVLDLYASAAGIRRALSPSRGVLGDLGALLDRPALSAAAISLSPGGSSLGIDVHSTLVPKPGRASPSRPVQFSPTLTGVLPAHSMLLLDAKGLRASVPKLLGLATRVGILGRLGPLLSRLGSALAAEGVNLRQVLGAFSGETAIALVPGRQGSGPAPVILTRTAHPAATRAVLANLDGPLSQVFAPPSGSPGRLPQAKESTVARVPVQELSLAPGLGLDYAVGHGLVVVSTELTGITDVLGRSKPISATKSFQSVLSDHRGRVTSLVFFDLSQLLRLGEQTGLIGGARQATLWSAAEKIHAAALESWRGAGDTTTRIRLQIP